VGQLNVSWTKGDGAEKTMVRRKIGEYPSSPSDGTQAYFDTGNNFNDIGLLPNTIYYYRAWSYKSGAPNEGYSDEYTGDWALTTGGGADVDVSWTKGSGAEKTMVRRKTGSYPASPTDGDEAYFDTGNSFIETLGYGTTYYYRAWSYKSGAPGDGYSDEYAQDTVTTPAAPTAYYTMVGLPTSWIWDRLPYGGTEKCPVGSETSWVWKAPTSGGPEKTIQGAPTSFSWGSE